MNDPASFLQLRQSMAQHFDLEELEMLAFDLGVDWDELKGATKSNKLFHLLRYLDRHGRLTELEAILQEKRPNYVWQGLFEEARPGHSLPNTQFVIAHFKKEKARFFLFKSKRDSFPRYTFTLMNRSGVPQIINRLQCHVIEYQPFAAVPETRILSPLVVWDIILPFGAGSFDFVPDDPVYLAAKDAVRITLRFQCEYSGKPIEPKNAGIYMVQVTFLTDQHLSAVSEKFYI